MFQSLRKKTFNCIRLSPNSTFDYHNPEGVKLITRLRVSLNHLTELKFKHSFQDTINPLCNCVKILSPLLTFSSTFFINERCTLLSTIHSLESRLLGFTNYDLTQVLLFGNTSIDNFKTINALIDYILSSKRFEKLLF